MSSVSLSLPLPSLDAAAPRRRAPDLDSQRAQEAFVLPPERAEAIARPVRDSARPADAREPERQRTDNRSDASADKTEPAGAGQSRQQAERPGSDASATDRSGPAKSGDGKTTDPKTTDSKSDPAKPPGETPVGGKAVAALLANVAGADQSSTTETPVVTEAKVDPAALFTLAVAQQSGAKAVGADKDKASQDADDIKDAADVETGIATPDAALVAPSPALQPGLFGLLSLSSATAAGTTADAAAGANGTIAAAQSAASTPQVAAATLASQQATTLAAAATDTKTGAEAKPGAAQGAGPSGKEAAGEAVPVLSPAAVAAETAKPADPAVAVQPPVDFSTLIPAGVGHQDTTKGLSGLTAAATTAAAPGPSSGANAAPAVPLHVVPIEIGLRALAGAKRFDIRLDPAELGRIDVNLEISDKGEVSARLVVDRVETLHLLQRDARTLERAFEQAGLKPSDAGVDISLRDPSDQSGFRQNRQQDDAPRRSRLTIDAPDEMSALAAQPIAARSLARLGGVDLSI